MRRKSLRVMYEIRLRWSDQIPREEGARVNGGLWIPETPDNQDKLAQAAALGNRVYGQGSHWIERRRA